MPWESGMIDMEMDDEASWDCPMPIAMSEKPRYPYELRIAFCQSTLDKLKLDKPESGDEIELKIRCCVTSVVDRDDESGKDCRVELQIIGINPEGT